MKLIGLFVFEKTMFNTLMGFQAERSNLTSGTNL